MINELIIRHIPYQYPIQGIGPAEFVIMTSEGEPVAGEHSLNLAVAFAQGFLSVPESYNITPARQRIIFDFDSNTRAYENRDCGFLEKSYDCGIRHPRSNSSYFKKHPTA